jgi:ribulose-phosphate 3-epimerase
MTTLQVAVSILNADLSALAETARQIGDAGADSIQVDVMDGHFVANLALGPQVCAAVAAHTTLPVEAHLMVEQPLQFLQAFADAGATHLIGHIEAIPDPAAFAARVRALGKRPGFAINPETPPDRLVPYLDTADLIVVMGIHPGAGGQTFMPSTLDTLRRLRVARTGASPRLQLDGGVNRDTVRQIAQAGADAVIGGSFVFRHAGGIAAAIAELKQP